MRETWNIESGTNAAGYVNIHLDLWCAPAFALHSFRDYMHLYVETMCFLVCCRRISLCGHVWFVCEAVQPGTWYTCLSRCSLACALARRLCIFYIPPCASVRRSIRTRMYRFAFSSDMRYSECRLLPHANIGSSERKPKGVPSPVPVYRAADDLLGEK